MKFAEEVVNKQMLGTSSMCICSSDGRIYLNEDITLSPRQWAFLFTLYTSAFHTQRGTAIHS